MANPRIRPAPAGKEKKQRKLLANLADHFRSVQREYHLPPGDFPDMQRFQARRCLFSARKPFAMHHVVTTHCGPAEVPAAADAALLHGFVGIMVNAWGDAQTPLVLPCRAYKPSAFA